ncbi:MAG: hypothetical protein ACREOF_15865 [Gemmatimonadales bacterium]
MTLTRRFPDDAGGAARRWLVFTVLAVGTLWLATDGRQYWHDARFAYGCAEFSLPQLLAGVFNPHQAWGPIDEASSAGFYQAKPLHFALLCSLFQWLPRGVGGFEAVVALSVLWVGLAVLAGYWSFRQIFGDERRARFATACLLLAPVTPYLAGKLLAEATSLLPATLAVGMFAGAMRAGGAVAGRAVVGGFLLALAALARLDSIVGPVSFLVVAVVIGWRDRPRAFRVGLLGCATFALIYLAAAAVVGVRFANLRAYFEAFTGSAAKPLATSLLAIVTTGALVFVLAAFGLRSRDRSTRLFTLWAVLVWAPMIALTSAYSVEPRYLVAGLLPLAGLGALGLEVLAERVPRLLRTPTGLAAATLVALGLNAAAVALMPYELDRPALVRAVGVIERSGPGTRILVPWAYTDFNFLQAVLPAAEIYCVHSPETEARPEYVDAWRARFRSWYGERYLTEPDRLRAFLATGPVYYLGWETYPPLANARAMAEAVGFRSVSERLGDLARRKLQNHLEESWIWRSKDLLVLEPAGRVGQYRYFRVRLREPL